MNWDMVGALAELAGALAVVATLAYLAIQVKQSNVAARVTAKQEMTKQYADYVDLLLLNPDLDEVYLKGNSGEPLDDRERRQYQRLMSKQCWYFAAMHFQFLSQDLSDDEWRQSLSTMSRAFRTPGFRNWWLGRKSDYSNDFVAFVDDIIEGTDA